MLQNSTSYVYTITAMINLEKIVIIIENYPKHERRNWPQLFFLLKLGPIKAAPASVSELQIAWITFHYNAS